MIEDLPIGLYEVAAARVNFQQPVPDIVIKIDQKWLSTTGFLDKVSENLTKAMAA